MILTLLRISQTDQVSFGVVKKNDLPLILTLEDPWRDNQPYISCIPYGDFDFERVFSNKFKLETFRAINIPGRVSIEWHPGNTIKNTHGCILTGSEFGSLSGVPAVLSSGRAFQKFINALVGIDSFTLSIVKGF